MKQAQIKCPHCGKPITVRQFEAFPIPPDAIDKIFDPVMKAMDTAFEKLGQLFK